MSSSTSNSEPVRESDSPLHVATALVRGATSTLIGAALFGFIVVVAARATPKPTAPTIESTIVESQRMRARVLDDVDVLVIGDSSALMGIDPTELGASIRGKSESLATLSFVGPAGYASLLERYVSREKKAKTLLLLMNGTALSLDEETFSQQGFESQAITGALPIEATRRGRIYDSLIGRWLNFPLPGLYGTTYGWSDDLAHAISINHGGLIDPNRYGAPSPPTPYIFTLSAAVTARLQTLSDFLSRPEAGRAFSNVVFAETPLPEALVTPETVATRASIQRQIAAILRITALDLPAALPNDDFATQTHLNARGRARYTRIVAEALGASPHASNSAR